MEDLYTTWYQGFWESYNQRGVDKSIDKQINKTVIHKLIQTYTITEFWQKYCSIQNSKRTPITYTLV